MHTVIVDEIHAVADDKRGSHLALTLARLDEYLVARRAATRNRSASASRPPSARSNEVARVPQRTTRQSSTSGTAATMDLAVEVPSDELGPVASNEMWGEIYDRVAELIAANRTTLVFVRRAA